MNYRTNPDHPICSMTSTTIRRIFFRHSFSFSRICPKKCFAIFFSIDTTESMSFCPRISFVRLDQSDFSEKKQTDRSIRRVFRLDGETFLHSHWRLIQDPMPLSHSICPMTLLTKKMAKNQNRFLSKSKCHIRSASNLPNIRPDLYF